MSILGASLEDDDKTIRRAYLRAVKQHPPERDPDGFARIREAYDVVTAQIVARRARHARTHEPTESSHRPASHPSASPPPSSQAAEPLPSPEGRQPEDDRAWLTSYYEREDELHDDAGRLGLWREAVAAHPDDPEVRRNLFDALWATHRRHEAMSLALALHDEGHPAALLAAAMAEPRKLPPVALAKLKKDRSPAVRAAMVEVHRRLRKGKRAAKLAVALLEQGPIVPPVRNIIDLLLQLEMTGTREPADRLREAFTTFLRRTGDERALLAAEASRWLVVRELAETRVLLRRELHRAIARAVRDDEPYFVTRAAHDLGEEETVRQAKLLEKRAPALNTMLLRALQLRRRALAQSTPEPQPRPGMSIWVYLFVVVPVLKLLFAQCSP